MTAINTHVHDPASDGNRGFTDDTFFKGELTFEQFKNQMITTNGGKDCKLEIGKDIRLSVLGDKIVVPVVATNKKTGKVTTHNFYMKEDVHGLLMQLPFESQYTMIPLRNAYNQV